MKVSAKAISSPGRTDKFQPALMLKFLRGNAGSKSRRSSSSRTRASPLFVRKKNNAVIETNQEPSSPKVSCIGQVRGVRVRRSSSGSKSNKTGTHRRRRSSLCSWVRKVKLRPSRLLRGLRRVWRKWVLFFGSGYCKKIDVREDSLESSSPNQRRQYLNNTVMQYEQKIAQIHGDEDEDGQGSEEFVSTCPPKNAFLLTRCRSAPYRSSSLASRFWGSPLKTGEEVDDEEDEGKQEREEEEERETTGPPSPCSTNVQEDLGSLVISHGRNSEGSRRRVEEFMAADGGPLILTRCKSEPAKTGEKLMIITPNKVGFC